MYFVLTTFTTVGYGDILASTVQEIIYVCFMMIMGSIVSAMIVSEIIGVFMQVDRQDSQIRKVKRMVEDFAHHTDLGHNMRHDLDKWCSSLRKLKQGVESDKMEKLICTYMPRHLVGRLPEHLFAGELMKNSLMISPVRALGQQIPPRMSLKLAVSLTQYFYKSEEVVYGARDYALNLYLVLQGTFAYVAKVGSFELAYGRSSSVKLKNVRNARAHQLDQLYDQEDRLYPYQLFSNRSHFGDLELLHGDKPVSRRTYARCVSTSGGVVLKLSREDLSSIDAEFGVVVDVWRTVAEKREIHRLDLLSRHQTALNFRELAACVIQRFVRERYFERLRRREQWMHVKEEEAAVLHDGTWIVPPNHILDAEAPPASNLEIIRS